MRFVVSHTKGKARRGQLITAHGTINTPCFMPVGTQATVKGLLPEMLEKADIILSNAYHLMLRPGADLIHSLGGLHKFMNWNKPILTDSGGFQIMSQSKLCKVKEDGVIFKSYIDGTSYNLTPELSMDVQYLLNSTITMVLDECISYPASYEESLRAMNLSMRWAKRCKSAYRIREGYGLFGIIQGGMYDDIRRESINILTDIDFNGYAIGGLAVGEEQEQMFSVLDYIEEYLPAEKPRYLMGVGKPSDIIGAVNRGVDMFDCVIPTRSGRNGQAFVKDGVVNIRNAKYRDDNQKLDQDCECYTCSNYTKAYLHHLMKAKEILASVLMSLHNIFFYQSLMENIRNDIEK